MPQDLAVVVVLDISNTMYSPITGDETQKRKITAAQEASEQFIKDFATSASDAEGATRKIGFVEFNTNAELVFGLQDCDNDAKAEQLSTTMKNKTNENFTNETQLANSGYGQGEVLVNPIHMAMVYSSFVNEGNMIMPYIEYKENASSDTATYYKKEAFSKEAADTIRDDLVQVVENPNGTAHSAKIEGKTISVKTGTAEIKQSKDDKEGTEIGWFNAFNVGENDENSLLIVSMVENVKGKGGSHYLLPKVKEIFETY